MIERLDSIPDLSKQLRNASPQIRRQVYEAFDLQIAFDKREGRVESSATVAEEVAKALNNSEELFAKGDSVTLANIAGAGIGPNGVPPVVVEMVVGFVSRPKDN